MAAAEWKPDPVHIRLLHDLPVEAKHGMRAGREFKTIGVKREDPLGDADEGRLIMYWVEGDADERVGVHRDECAVIVIDSRR